MKKILLSTLLVITLSSAEDVNTIKINDGTKPKIDLMAEIMKLDAREKLLDKEIEAEKSKTALMKAKTRDLKEKLTQKDEELESAVELGKTLDELRDTLVSKWNIWPNEKDMLKF